MTARYFCDICTREVESTEPKRDFRVEVVLHKPPSGYTSTRSVGVEISRSIDGVWNGGHICNHCLRAALREVRNQLKGGDR